MRRADLRLVIRSIAKLVKATLATQAKRIDALEAQTKQLKYCGTFQRANAESYKRNNAVTHGGSVWIAVVDAPTHEPGSGGDWQLAVKGKA